MAVSTADQLRDLLEKAFAPETLEIIDDSASHAGHAGNPSGASQGTHFFVTIVSPAFEGMGRVDAQRAVYQVAAPLMEPKGSIHALALNVKSR